MPESRWHKHLKRKDAGSTGQTEVVLPSGSRLDALSPTKIATQIERGGEETIKKAISILKEAVDTGIARKARLRVLHEKLDFAYDEMRRQRLHGELTNVTSTYKTQVPRRRK